MATTYTAATKFTAIDKFSATVSKMTKATDSLSSKLAGLGLAFSGIAVAQQIVQANLNAEKSFASLSAVTGVSGAAFDQFKNQAAQAANKTGMFVGDMAKAFELIGSQKPELLANAAAMRNVTEAAVTLSRASGEDLAASSGNLTGIMNQFDLAASKATNTINVLAAGTIAGAASIADVSESLKNVGSVAKMSNMSLEQTVAALQTLSLKKITGAEAGTKLRGALIKLKDAGMGYASGQFQINDALLEAQKKMSLLKTAKEKDAFASKIFGIENLNAGLILIDSMGKMKEMTTQVTNTNSAFEMASKNTSTMAFQIEELKNRFLNLMTTTDKNNAIMGMARNIIGYLSANMETLLGLVGGAIGLWLAYKAVLIANTIYTTGLSVATGIMGAVTGICSVAIGKSTIAMNAYKVALMITTAAQWLMNTSLFAIIWPIAAVIAASIAIIAVFKNWGSIVQWLTSLWSGLVSMWFTFVDAMKSIEWIENFKMIGNSIISFILLPLKAILTIIAALPGKVGAVGEAGLKQLNKLQFETKQQQLANPDAAKTSAVTNTQRIEKTSNSKVQVEVKATQGSEASINSSKNLNAKVTNTVGFQR